MEWSSRSDDVLPLSLRCVTTSGREDDGEREIRSGGVASFLELHAGQSIGVLPRLPLRGYPQL